MDVLQDLTAAGTKIGLTGTELRDFVTQQQQLARDERAAERDRRLKEREFEQNEANRVLREKELAQAESERERQRKFELDKLRSEEERREKEGIEKEKERAFEMDKLEKEREFERFRLENYPQGGNVGQGGTQPNHTIKGPKLPHFEEGKDDMDAYLQRFERYATAQKWHHDHWASNLSALLKGKALEVYSRLTPDLALDYETLKQALLRRFEKTEEGFKKRFRTARPEQGETFSQFVLRLGNYFGRWVDCTKIDKTFDALVDLLVRDQLLQSCGRELTLFLKERKPDNVTSMGDLADTFCDARGGNISMVSLSQRPVQKQARDESRGRSSTKPAIPIGQRESPGRWPERRCFICNSNSHIARDCKLKEKSQKSYTAAAAVDNSSGKSGNGEYNRSFRFGGKPNHRKRSDQADRGDKDGTKPVKTDFGGCCQVVTSTTQSSVQTINSNGNVSTVVSSMFSGSKMASMPTIVGSVNGHKVTVLRDTGCSSVVVKHSLVREEDMLSKTHTCLLVDGSEIPTPVAMVEVSTPYYSGRVEALCMEKPIFDLIIGNIPGVDDSHMNTGKPVGQVAEVKIEVAQGVQTRAQKAKEGKPFVGLKVPDPIVEVDSTHFKVEQENDTSLDVVREAIRKGYVRTLASGATHSYAVKRGLLVRKYESPLVDHGRKFTQVVVPKKYRDDVMKLAHETLLAGHQGSKRTALRVLDEFYWPGVQADITRYCRSCDICQRTTPKGKVTRVPLGEMPIIDTPFQRIAVDLVGPLKPPTERGNRYILSIVDYATRYPEAVPLPGIDTERVAEALVDVFSRVGVPREMLTDMGSQFTSGLMAEVSRLLSLRQLTTTPYHPICNGLVERFNGTMKQMLKRLCADRPQDWDRYVNALLFAYREVPQESLGFSPFELLYGRTVRGPMRILRELLTKEMDDPEVKTTYQYVVDLRNKLESTCGQAHDNLRKSAARYRKGYNRKARRRDMLVGEQVLVLLPTKTNKLQMQWKGPYSIVEKVGQMDYRILVRGKTKTFHANMLKKYLARTPVDTQEVVGGVLEVVSIAVVDMTEDEIDDVQDSMSDASSTPPGSCATETSADVQVSETLNRQQKEDVRRLLYEFQDVLTDVPGYTNLIEHDIIMTTDTPVRVKQYPLPLHMTEAIKSEVQEMVRLKVIEPSSSAYSSPVIIVKKKDGKNRVCLDFRQLNRQTVFDAEPIPNIEEVFAKLAGHKYYSKLDLSKGYWQVPMAEQAKEKTAFSTPFGLFQFRVMPFGLVNARATFSRLMRKLLAELDNLDNFIDDILVYTQDVARADRCSEIVVADLKEGQHHCSSHKVFCRL
jgi:hypothetical protein